MRQMPGVQELKRGGCGAFGRLRSDHEKKIAPLTEIRSPMAERFRNTALVPLLRTNPDDFARKNRIWRGEGRVRERNGARRTTPR